VGLPDGEKMVQDRAIVTTADQ